MSAGGIRSAIVASGVLVIAGVLAPLGPAAALADNPMRITVEPSVVSVHKGDSALLQYRYRKVPFKPYVRQIFSPKGVGILRDAPHDHLHHHALMFAVSVDGVDFWSERKTCGRQVHRGLADVHGQKRGQTPEAGFTELLDWVAPKAQNVLLKERRTIKVHGDAPPGASLVTWRSRLEPGPGKKTARLTGAHYFGLGMRFVVSMDKGGRFFNPTQQAGKVVRGTERLVSAPWCAYTARAGGKVVTVAMFDHPGNARQALWFTMTKPFAYLAATTNLWKQPLTLPAGQTLELVYGVALWDGLAKADAIEKLYKHWVSRAPKPAPAPKETVKRPILARPAPGRRATARKGASQ